MEDDYDFDRRSKQEVLLSFAANKGHRTRQANKIDNLLALQDQKYSKTTENTLLQIVAALERYQDRLNIFSSWLNLHTLESAAAHVAEAETLAIATETLVNRVIEQIHNHDPPIPGGAAGAPAPQAQAQATTAKPVIALKPDRLSFDANLGTVR